MAGQVCVLRLLGPVNVPLFPSPSFWDPRASVYSVFFGVFVCFFCEEADNFGRV